MQIAEAHLKAFEAYTEMTEATRNQLVVMPTDIKALVDVLFCLEKNFSVLPPEISNGQSLAFELLRTVWLSHRAIRSTESTGRHKKAPVYLSAVGSANPNRRSVWFDQLQ
jgi:hypothetical protein